MKLLEEMRIPADLRECIENCSDCFSACEATIQHCLSMGGEHGERSHIRLLMDCSAICKLAEDFMTRQSPFHNDTCGVCATICNACAADCERIGSDDEMMMCCVDACRKCADSCMEMANR